MNRATGVISFAKASRLSALLMGASKEVRDEVERSNSIIIISQNVEYHRWVCVYASEGSALCYTVRCERFTDAEGRSFFGERVDTFYSVTWVDTKHPDVSIHLVRRDESTFTLRLVGTDVDETHIAIFDRYVEPDGPEHERKMHWPNPHIIGGDGRSLEDSGHILIAAVIKPVRECLDRVHRRHDIPAS